MALELRDCTFHGPALPEPFVKFQLEETLKKLTLLAKPTGLPMEQRELWLTFCDRVSTTCKQTTSDSLASMDQQCIG